MKVFVIIASSIVGLCLIALIAMPFVVMPNFLNKRIEQVQHSSTDYGIESERITLTTDDELKLAAWRTYAPDSFAQPNGTVIILSGIENPSVTAFFSYAKMLADNGWDSLLIEMRAKSLSEGKTLGFGLTEWQDVKAGVEFLEKDERAADALIVTLGTSMGGATVITAAGEIPRIDAVISLSAFSSIGSMITETAASLGVPRIVGILDTPFLNAYIGFVLGFDKLKYSAENGVAKLGDRPLLLAHSTRDSEVAFSEYEKLLKAAEKNNVDVTTFVREGDWHFIVYDEHSENPVNDTEFSAMILNFLGKLVQN